MASAASDPNDGSVQARCWSIASAGSIDSLTLQECTVPPPSEEQVRIRVKAVGVNFADVLIVFGVHPVRPSVTNPVTLGFEVAGVVDSVGSSVADRFTVGQRVWSLVNLGAYTTVLNVDASSVYEIPEEWSFTEAAAFPLHTLTAYFALTIYGRVSVNSDLYDGLPVLSPRKAVLVHSAAGGVGQRVLQLLKRANATTVCVVGSESKAQYLREHHGIARERVVVRGVDENTPVEFERVVKERALDGGPEAKLDVVLDSTCGSYFHPGWNCLRPGGSYVVYGFSDLLPPGSLRKSHVQVVLDFLGMAYRYFTRPKVDILNTLAEPRSLSSVNVTALLEDKALARAATERVLELNLPPASVSMVYQFDAAQEALRYLSSGQSVGKLCLLVD